MFQDQYELYIIKSAVSAISVRLKYEIVNNVNPNKQQGMWKKGKN